MSDWMFETPSADGGQIADLFTPPAQPIDENWLGDSLKAETFSPDEILFNGLFNNGDVTDLDDVVATGTRWPSFPSFPGNPEVSPSLFDDTDDGGGGMWADPDGQDEDCGPSPDGPTPEGYSMDDIRDAARIVAEVISGLSNGNEWTSILYVVDGGIYSTPPYPSPNDEDAVIDRAAIPTDAHVVAWVHSHPHRMQDASQGRLNSVDASAIERITHPSGRYTVDSSLMAYILAGNKLYEFDQDDQEGDRGADVTRCGAGA